MGIAIESGITIEGGISIVVDYGTPTNTVAPVISVATPNVRVGKTLTSTTGTWISSFSILGYNYQWYADSILISGATANTYVIQSGDLGKYITCQVTAYSSYGNGLPATSNILGPVLPAIVNPTIGDYVYGGYYAGIVGSDYLIVADATTEITGSYYTAYPYCESLVSGGYSDWRIPDSSYYILMYSAYTNPLWPSSQDYYVTPTSGRINYWSRTVPNPSPSSLVTVFRFYGNTFDANYPTYTTFSVRATRLEPIPT